MMFARRRLVPLVLVAAAAVAVFALTARPRSARAASSSCASSELKLYAGPLKVGSVPVVFIHGITGSPTIFTDSGAHGSPSLAKRVAAISDTSVWTFNYHDYSLDWVTNSHIGPAFAKALACLARDSSHRVIVIAHSMGGLVTQYAAARPDGAGSRVGDHLAHVFAIATPFTGSKLLTALKDASRGTAATDPEESAAVDAIFSKCAGLAESAYAKGKTNTPCSLLSLPGSPVGTALRYDSAEIQALPPWPSSLPVTDVAGDIDLTFGVWKLKHTFDVGDIAVSDDSATAHNTSGKPIRVVCHDSLVSMLDSPCYHSNLPRDPAVETALLPDVRSAVSTEQKTFLPAASGPNDWASYLPVVAGRVCTSTSTSTFGQFKSVATGTSTIIAPKLAPDGVHFSLQNVTNVTTTGPGTPTQTQSQTMTYPYVLANDGTVRASPGDITKSGISFTYSGFEVWPTIGALRQGQSTTTTITATLEGTTPATKSALQQALNNGQDSATVSVTFKIGPAPPLSSISTPAGTFRNLVGVQEQIVSANAPGAPAGTDSDITSVASALGEGKTDVYFAQGVGIVETKLSGGLAALSSPVELSGCRS